VPESTALDGLELMVEGKRELCETGPDDGTVWKVVEGKRELCETGPDDGTVWKVVEGKRELCETGPDDGIVRKEDTLSISDSQQ